MAQAHRIKTDPAVMRAGVFRFLNRIARESGFWLLAVLAVGMIVALATFNPADPAWTHTAGVVRLHNLGGAPGAWFADTMLYFFGYPAYLLPLGIVFGGWQLFKRGGLLALDGEIVLFRVLGFAVALATACGLAALHLRVIPATLPGEGTAGGLVGIHVGQFLTHAFGFAGGNLFMAALLLAGVMLATGASWLTILDGIGTGTLRLLDWIGGLALAPLRWWGSVAKTKTEAADDGANAAPGESGPTDEGEVAPSKPQPALRRAQEWLVGAGQSVFAASSAWWSTHHPVSKAGPTVTKPSASGTPPLDADVAEEVAATPDSRSGRIEPVLHLPTTEKAPPPPTPVAAVAAVPPPVEETVLETPYLDMLTLLPTMSASPAPTTPPVMPPLPSVQTPWQPGEGFTVHPSPSSPPEPIPPPTPPTELDPQDLDDANWTTPVPIPPIQLPTASMARRVAVPPPVSIPYPLPALALLDPPPPRPDGYSPEALTGMSRQVETQLKSFGIEVNVVAVEPGPVITRFEIDPAPGIKVSQISNLAKDLARGLRVVSVRVVEIIPGKAVIGLEIPNRQRETVYLRGVLESPVYTQSASPLTLALGKDIGGNPVVANLNKMPHLLVAGTTGSGKSVAINAMLLSLLYKASPSEVRLILVDPKMLELSVYEDIPHLLTPVVTDMKEAANALRWCVGEMERRYRLMMTLKVRNIAGFNRKVLDALAAGERLTDPVWKADGSGMPRELPLLQPLPFIVVVIDELADLMMIVGKKVEELIARLAQKARAAGIHLILATQRPSVDVITGLIKANIPTRIAFQVSSRVDSRTILDQMGAEQLLGHGDMLYLPPGTGLPQRVHGAFVDDHEVNRIVDYLRSTGAPDYVDEVLAEPGGENSENGSVSEGDGRSGESDPLYDEAVRIVTESRRASVSGVQRRLRIGYNRAARLVETMETAGVVGRVQSNGSREVLAPPPRM